MELVINLIMLFFINLVLSLDNSILIAMVTKNLSKENRKIATIWGTIGAVSLRFIFIIAVLFVLEIVKDTPFIFILAGGALVVVGLLLTNPEKEKEAKVIENVWKSIGVILAADAMMSLENSLIVADDVRQMYSTPLWSWDGFNVGKHEFYWGQILIIFIVLMTSIPIIIYGTKYIGTFIEKHEWVKYIASILIIASGISMIFEDHATTWLTSGGTIKEILGGWGTELVSYSTAAVLAAGKYLIYDNPKEQAKKENKK